MKGMKCLVVLTFVTALMWSSAASAISKDDLAAQSRVGTPLPHICEMIGEISVNGCKSNPLISRMGCDDIVPPPEHWGGLKPFLGMGICVNMRNTSGPMVRQTGCKTPVRERYFVLIEKGNKKEVRLIESKEEFRQFFAPITTPQEAISYISALTGSYPRYEFPKENYIHTMEENGRYLSKKQKPTESLEKKDGFHVRLFDHERCGCFRPTLYEINYIVTKDGYISVKKKQPIWEAARSYQICID